MKFKTVVQKPSETAIFSLRFRDNHIKQKNLYARKLSSWKTLMLKNSDVVA